MEASKAGYDHSWRSSLNIEKKKKALSIIDQKSIELSIIGMK